MNTLTPLDVEAAGRLALSRLDDDGAPAAASVVYGEGGKAARIPAASAADAPAAVPAGLPSPRVSFDPALSRDGAVDGGWWPHSRNAQTELPGLIAALDTRPGVRVARVAVHRDEWEEIPRRLRTDAGRVVRVGWFTTIRRHTVSVTTVGSRLPITLLVVPPGTPAGIAAAAAIRCDVMPGASSMSSFPDKATTA